MKKKLVIGASIIVIAFSSFVGFASANQQNLNQCNSNNPWNCPAPTEICNNGQHTGNPHCNPTATPTTKPTATPTPGCFFTVEGNKVYYPCPSPTVTPTCGWNVDHPCATPTPTKGCEDDEDCVTPTPTATPSATPTPTQPPGNNNGGSSGSTDTTEAPGPTVCNVPFQAPILQGFQADGNGSVTFSWWPSPNVSKYSITYGYTPDNLMFGEDNIPSTSTSIQINDLIPGHNVWAQIQAWQGGCEESSNLLDPIIR